MSLHVAVSGWLLGPPSGANRRLPALLRELGPLLASDERITVLHRRDFAPPFVHERIAWHAVAIPAAPTWRRVFAEWRVLPRLLRELRVDVLDHGFLPAPRVSCPVVLTLHDLRDADGEGRRARWLARFVLRRSLRLAAAVVVPSAFTAARIRAHAPAPPPIAIVPNGTDLPPAAPAEDAGTYFLHVGHLEPRKNLDVLLRAFAVPGQLRARCELRLAGADAGDGSRLRALAARLGIGDRVRFLGVVPDAALASLYAGARAVCVPSRYEGFGLCALEGLAHGRPVLVANAGALPEVVGDQGVVLPPDDAAAWAAAIEATASTRPEAARERRARAAQWSWPAAATQLLTLWRQRRGAATLW